MSGISNYTLNQKINAVLGKISGIPSVINLDTTLTTGNNAGANDIDMNNNDILQLNNINNFLYFDSVNSRLGINVPAPTEDLELDGNFQLDTGSTSKIVFYDKPNDHEHAEIDAIGEGANGGALKFQTKVDGGSVTEKLRINNTGALGLGGANYGTAGQVLTSQGSSALPTWSAPTTTGYSFVERLRYTTAGSFTFTKASYPYLRAIKVVCVGGGGGGGQTDYLAVAGDSAAGSGGSGGSYAERFITDIAGLSASVPIVVGGGGTGGIGGTSGTPGGTLAGDGGDSEFGLVTDAYYTKGGGGQGGGRGFETQSFYGASGVNGNSGIGDFTIIGFPSENSWSVGSIDANLVYLAVASNGGNSVLGTGGRNGIVRISSSTLVRNGNGGLAFGGGGAGGCGATFIGGYDGADGGGGARGTIWVELYA